MWTACRQGPGDAASGVIPLPRLDWEAPRRYSLGASPGLAAPLPGGPLEAQDIVYGVRPVQEALSAQPEDVIEIRVAKGRHGPGIERMLADARARGIPVHPRPADALTKAAGSDHHQGLVAIIRGFRYAELDTLIQAARGASAPPMIVALDCVQDPHNLGAVLRSAHALGALGVVIPRDRAVGVTPTVRKTSAGATSHVPIAQVTNLARALRALFDEGGLWPLALIPDGPRPLAELDLTLPLTLVVGSEGKGIRPAVRKACELEGRIPLMGQVASLNASAAAAIACYEVARQRAAAGDPRR